LETFSDAVLKFGTNHASKFHSYSIFDSILLTSLKFHYHIFKFPNPHY